MLIGDNSLISRLIVATILFTNNFKVVEYKVIITVDKLNKLINYYGIKLYYIIQLNSVFLKNYIGHIRVKYSLK